MKPVPEKKGMEAEGGNSALYYRKVKIQICGMGQIAGFLYRVWQVHLHEILEQSEKIESEFKASFYFNTIARSD